MDEKFQNRYRIASARAPWWDYGKNGSYFITICSKNRVHFFGEIQDGIMKKSPIGNIVQSIWEEIPVRFSYARLGVFIVMPNHIHGIVTIDKPNVDGLDGDICYDGLDADVEKRLIASLRLRPNHQQLDCHVDPKSQSHPGGITGMHNPMLHQNLSRVIRWFTGRVTFESHKVDPLFNWQRRFHDRIVRDESEYARIERYIVRNPLNWDNDRFR